ncbi:NAD(P)-dependent oxidoreductase [Leptospira santarosai]|uniref:NAD(P)-dependent oxidoreductase n=1 Tax=Leptospira santarosai TaxID=28183 RepID=UPI0002BEB466|nr:NAD(P)-dependent oxidoreductase [Leptospira santarosai]EMP82336.1 4-phosphoerythronate dehydrogenase [Leptospira santarosai str. CBC1531]MDI7198162.1 NAD(P)-dependent oxidoreductase [Leptospira santarosai]MDI7203710.1 NAD(P)-dependent oxidoreductase [Leptospira santarosai]
MKNLSIHLLFPESDYDDIISKIENRIGNNIIITKGKETPKPFSCLFIAPHEFSMESQIHFLQQFEWKWIHLSTAGYDFFPLEIVSPYTWVTRSWKAYAKPLTEYILYYALRYARDIRRAGLLNQKMGIIGFGEVGKLIARTFHSLGTEVKVLRKNKIYDSDFFITTDINDLLDIDQLVLAVPLNSQSEKIIDENFLFRCKEGMHIMNIARGELIDQVALLQAIKNRNLYASLDVTIPEPLPADHPFRKEKNVNITNHIAWKSGPDINYFVEDFIDIWNCISIRERPESGILKSPEITFYQNKPS